MLQLVNMTLFTVDTHYSNYKTNTLTSLAVTQHTFYIEPMSALCVGPRAGQNTERYWVDVGCIWNNHIGPMSSRLEFIYWPDIGFLLRSDIVERHFAGIPKTVLQSQLNIFFTHMNISNISTICKRAHKFEKVQVRHIYLPLKAKFIYTTCILGFFLL